LYQLGANPPPRLLIAHLGNGCSISAVRDGRSIDTSMGLTPTGGIVSSGRTGDIDPGVLLYILRDLKPDEGSSALSRDDAANKLETLVNRKSGMLGISGGMSDMRDLRGAIQAGNPAAATAVGQFTYVIRKFIGAYVAILCGLDMLVFTGGIGEHDVDTRREICACLEDLGIVIDPERNRSLRKDANGQAVISADHSAVKVMVIPPLEDLMIADHVWSLMHG
jgi:acetate kinase